MSCFILSEFIYNTDSLSDSYETADTLRCRADCDVGRTKRSVSAFFSKAKISLRSFQHSGAMYFRSADTPRFVTKEKSSGVLK
ncbi:MAG: hypothetical protein BWK80_52985 [Desulfobacteraceae bacterium IS3]|nr:MAG: hypothetical protein BWK80_52985 [Desulfobacteraceae bacterium IS3]